MVTLNAAEMAPVKLYGYLIHAVAPRPICFASTISKEGQVNLSPFSLFNLMSTNPPIVAFSPISNRNNDPKHTLLNIQEVPEVVINIVNYPMVQQMNLTSGEYEREVNEFVKSGFTPIPAVSVAPPMVAESPVQLECKVTQIVNLGTEANAGNIVIAEVKLMHIKDEMLDADGKIDQAKLDLVARLGGDWYCRVTQDNLFKVPRPVIGVGIDGLPEQIRQSDVLTGNDLGMLSNTEHLPDAAAIQNFKTTTQMQELLKKKDQLALHSYIKRLLHEGRLEEARLAAWSVD